MSVHVAGMRKARPTGRAGSAGVVDGVEWSWAEFAETEGDGVPSAPI